MTETGSVGDHLRGKGWEERAKSPPSVGRQGAGKSRIVEMLNTSRREISREDM